MVNYYLLVLSYLHNGCYFNKKKSFKDYKLKRIKTQPSAIITFFYEHNTKLANKETLAKKILAVNK